MMMKTINLINFYFFLLLPFLFEYKMEPYTDTNHHQKKPN